MSKGLEALEKLGEMTLESEYGDEPKVKGLVLYDIIEKDLNDYENLKLKHRSMQDAVLEDFKKLKALEIIKNKKVDIHTLYRDSDIIGDTFDYYNNSMLLNRGKQYELTQEEYDLIKEVLL